MTNDEYITQVLRTESINFDPVHARFLHAAMGCVTEAGEMMDSVKKSCFYGQELDRVSLEEEAGDMLWYIALLLNELGVTFEQVMETNIAKLRIRYPKQFTEGAAGNRDLDAERKTLERGRDMGWDEGLGKTADGTKIP